jgi:hypothetical protein
VLDLLRQIAESSETDPQLRLAELTRRRDVIDAEIDQLRAGRLSLMDPTQLRERFLQAIDTARALPAAFRQVEQNFRDLDRQVRERIATREDGKSDALEQAFSERDAIVDAHLERSLRADWEFLMSAAREELTQLLERVFSLDAVAELPLDTRLKRIDYDWLNAGDATQRTALRAAPALSRPLATGRFRPSPVWESGRVLKGRAAEIGVCDALRPASPASASRTGRMGSLKADTCRPTT